MKMESNLTAAAEAEEEEDYINMELSYSPSKSPPKINEFEFQFFSTASESAADDLFFKGKLLPLHLPPRRQMLHSLTAAAALRRDCSTAPCTSSNTPSDSRNISPSQSCRASCDLNPSDLAPFQFQFQFQFPTQISAFFPNSHPQSSSHAASWSKRLKSKRSFIAQKLRSFKSFFRKSDGESSSPAAAAAAAVKYSRFGRKFADLVRRNGIDDHRRSFSGAIAADFSTTTTNCSSSSLSSSSSSFNSSGGLHELQFLRRSSSAAEIEVSIDAAIAHCKKSMVDSSFSSN